MTDSVMAPAQAAIYTLLKADATLTGLVDAVADAVPEPVVYTKYVQMGEAMETPDNTFGKYGSDLLFTIHVWALDSPSRSGWKTAQTINSRVIALLDGATLTIPGRALVLCHLDASQSVLDPPWRHIATDFRIITEEP